MPTNGYPFHKHFYELSLIENDMMYKRIYSEIVKTGRCKDESKK